MSKKQELVKRSQGLYSKLREIYENGQGIVNYHFEEIKSFNDYSKHDIANYPKDKELPKPHVIEEKGKKWTIQQPINKEVFFNEKGKHNQLEDVVQLFKDIADDMGAKYFSI